jgi:hypothetical protein
MLKVRTVRVAIAIFFEREAAQVRNGATVWVEGRALAAVEGT